MNKYALLSSLSFGQRVAEEEADVLERYFVETDHWRRLLRGDVDIVYGPKGAGKSALYFLLLSRRDELFDRGILLVAAENPRGATAFRGLVADPPASESEFAALWKLYFACLISSVLTEYGLGGDAGRKLQIALEAEGLVARERNLVGMLRTAFDYVRKVFRPGGISAGVKLDSQGMPTGFEGKITFSEPTPTERGRGATSIDILLRDANDALEDGGFELWIVLDRLDVAFAESAELEQNALRALFHVYLDLTGFSRIKLKVFLRSDIWQRLTKTGFREASHITRAATITWSSQSLLNLIVSRTLQNAPLVASYGVEPEDTLSSLDKQSTFLARIFPEQIDVGPNKPRTLDWIIGRTRDASKMAAPREVIHLLNASRDVQVRKLEVGESEPEGEHLFSRQAFKEALVEVSRVRLQQTLYAEYPTLRDSVEQLRGEKTSQTVESLAAIWKVNREEATRMASALAEAGFFEVRGSKEAPEYWVPFLYRDALDLVQGSAD